LKAQKYMSAIPPNGKSAELPVRHLVHQTRSTYQPTVLVVEDHDDTREMLHVVLEMWGCRVVEACNGLEAVEAASRERPQVILMDSRLPFVNGLEATRRIRENGLLDDVRILAVDSSGSPCYHADALAAGCDDSIKKPFDLDSLRTYLFCPSILPLVPNETRITVSQVNV
jgi:CheY-like chemotaxis protein